MSEKFSSSPERNDTPDEASFVEHQLGRHEKADDKGIDHPVYTIEGRRVMFRNFAEEIALDEATHEITDGEPAENRDTDDEEAILVATNTPEGIMTLVRTLAQTPENQQQTERVEEKLASNEYSHLMLDSIIAATMYDADGERVSDGVNSDGFAIVTAALVGETEAQKIVISKLDRLYSDIEKQETARTLENQEIFAERLEAYGEGLDPSKVTLVHSTKYPIERNEAGQIVLYNASTKREDRLPRSTVHFTPNGEVSSHLGGTWGNENRLIVTNLAKMMEQNGAPRTMASADTFFSVGPGEAIALPDALTIESRAAGDKLFDQSDEGVSYLNQEKYTSEQESELRRLAEQFGISLDAEPNFNAVARELALRMAEKSLGADNFMEIGDHYATDSSFDSSYAQMALRLGADSNLHANTPERSVEWGSYRRQQSGDYSSLAAPDSLRQAAYPEGASLNSLRTLVYSGFLPARPIQYNKQPFDHDMQF